ncbi:hypothetical protein EPUS_07849 [Endocarpon pusillum Z07020]|uniref:Uncharacterized protein n=1 Tax=Endocarpon pusillum (strain Z07020 / HMAS-L-300199) TaxID=1263415 RepID=U1HH08_ENDPU|nr:uncharacterized protein EPUS_07849 [Endocarpon pusillum Z07020]ERF69445.1 hypothetical protein EPUS_07849 [Endocarpon pusillum Z07020]
MSSNIHVFVRFKEQSIFAGEEIQSIITFKNVANTPDDITSETKTWRPRGWVPFANPAEHSGESGSLSSQTPRLTAINNHGARKASKSGHRNNASLNIPFIASPVPRSASWTASPVTRSGPVDNHQRSVSIISLGSPDAGKDEGQRPTLPQRSRPTLNHGRSASLQVQHRGNDENYLELSSAFGTPELQASIQNEGNLLSRPQKPRRKDCADAQHASISGSTGSRSRKLSPPPQGFNFPSASEETSLAAPPTDRSRPSSNPQSTDEALQTAKSLTLETMGSLGQAIKVLAGTSVVGSNRSSGDFRSLSNPSQETLLSEQASNSFDRHVFRSPPMRQHYRASSTSKPKWISETLLMGYAQVNATFTLDGALVDQTPFEEVKRKGFLGGQAGGGVVGVQTSSNAGGILGGFTLNSIGESLGGLLGGADLSSLKEMKGLASTRAIPLLSTPQSLLFVDLTLAPGEEKSFSFRYILPRGLPASYKGTSIKIMYNLTIGVQVAPKAKAAQAVRRVNIPFKVFSGVNEDGEIFGHDLMQPYVILKDTAQSEAVDSTSNFPERAPNAPGKSTEGSTKEFLTYVDSLLNKRRRRQSSSATIEPLRYLLTTNGSSMAKQAIDRAILLSKQSSSSHQSSSRFDIARNGKRIATIVLDRTLYRLGESVTASVDFSNPQMPCYSLRCSLESTENVNPALALRSAASITRLSRRVYRLQSENTLFAERIVFSLSIPTTASPTLLTSGVNLDWAIRFEFVTTLATESVDDKEQSDDKELLESVTKDERGTILAAVETLQCETFEVSIPITVYGDTIVAGTDAEETVGHPI